MDRSREARIAELDEGEEALVIGRVRSVSSRRTRRRHTMVTVELEDRSGRLRCTFFNQPWRERQARPAVGDRGGWQSSARWRSTRVRQMTNPVVDLVGDRTGRIVPIYPQSAKSGSAAQDFSSWVSEPCGAVPRGIADPLPRWLLDELSYCSREEALRSAS
ncbi:MAG: OB-fold nucleic acid binding domain-containing protein [Microthrixaceae bacterium]